MIMANRPEDIHAGRFLFNDWDIIMLFHPEIIPHF